MRSVSIAFSASGDTVPRVVVVDNASPDASCDVIRRWAARHAGRVSFAEAEVGAIARSDSWLTLLRAPVNGGFAYATNRALEVLLADLRSICSGCSILTRALRPMPLRITPAPGPMGISH